MEFQAVLDVVRSLPVDDQVRLVDQIHDDLQELAKDFQMSPAQIKEIERRINAYEANPRIGIPWEEVAARVDKQLEELGE